MYQPPAPAPAAPFSSAYQYNAEYNLQPQDDHDEIRDGVSAEKAARYPVKRPRRPNYRPTPLRWPFIACLILVFCAAIALIVWVRQTMPDSDSDAIVDQNAMQVVARDGAANRALGPAMRAEAKRSASDSSSTTITISSSSPPTSVSSTASSTPAPQTSSSSLPPPPPSTTSTTSTSAPPPTTSTTSTSAPPAVSSTPTPTSTTSPPPERPSSSTSHSSAPLPATTSISVTPTTSRSSTSSDGPGTTSSAAKGAQVSTSSTSTTSTTSSTSRSTSRSASGQIHAPIVQTTIIEKNVTQTLTRSGTTRTDFSTGSTTLFATTTEVLTSVIYESTPYPTVGASYWHPPPPPIVSTKTGTTFTTTGTRTITSVGTQTVVGDGGTTRVIKTTQVSEVKTTETVEVPDETTTHTPKNPFFSTPKGSTILVTTVIVRPTETNAFVTTSVTTESPVVYVQIGPTTITSYSTIFGPIQTKQPDPVTIAITKVFDGTTITQVKEVAPQTVVSEYNQVETEVVTPVAKTYLTTEPGSVMTTIIYVTPVAVATTDIVKQVVSTVGGTVATFTREVGQVFTTTVDGSVATLTATAPAVYTSVVGGTITTVRVDTPQTNFGPITMTVVTQIGGTTQVLTTTETETLVTNINGLLTTIVTSVPRTITTVIGGTPTTMVVTTTPTATPAIPFTVLITGSGTVRTLVSTFAPSTIVKTVSGKLTTIVSTPRPSTFLSTINPSTTTILSVSTPGASPIGNSSIIVAVAQSYDLTLGDYFVGRFLPTILAVLLSIPLRVLDLNAKLYQPFYALARDGGALGVNSINLNYNGFRGFVTPFVTLFQGHPVPFLTTLLVGCSALLAPLSAEALGLKVHGSCKVNVIDGCATVLGVSPVPMHLLLALLAFMVTVLLILLFFLRKWETGLYANPWSVAGIASLAINREVRIHTSKESKVRAMTDERRYALGYFENDRGVDEYGIVLADDAGRRLHYDPAGAVNYHDEDIDEAQSGRPKPRHTVPFMALSYTWRLAFAVFLLGIIGLVLYYTLTQSTWSTFKSFMDSQSFGVRFFFAALGVIIDFCWTAFFISVAVMGPYQQMSQRAQPPERSILISRPTNGFFGVYAAFRERNVFLLVVAVMTVASEFLPILLSNVPHTLTQNETTHVVCSRLSIAILALMVLVILGSLFVKWPHMPVDPRSIAGALYYVSGSTMLPDFEGISRLTTQERARRVREMGKRYFYGDIYTPSGRRRTGVDGDSGFGDDVQTHYVGHQL